MTFEDYYAEHFSENLKGGLYLEFKRTWEAAQKAERERIGYLLFKKTWNAAQIAERDRIKNIVEQVGVQGNHDEWFDCCDTIIEGIG